VLVPLAHVRGGRWAHAPTGDDPPHAAGHGTAHARSRRDQLRLTRGRPHNERIAGNTGRRRGVADLLSGPGI